MRLKHWWGLIGGIFLASCDRAIFIQPQLPSGGINSFAPDESPSYSADGQYLAFSSDRNGRREIFLYALNQRRLIPLPNLNQPNSTQSEPSLSNDGRWIAYVSTSRGKTDIMLYDRDRQHSELLTANVRGSVRHPTISGDGKRIAFQSNQLGQWDIVLIDR